MKKTKKLWFKAKLYGWGWYPSSWQGLIILLLSISVFAFFWIKILKGQDVIFNSIAIAADFLALIIICYKTGEKPRWRWGK
jgi:hypothetical protein